MVGLRSPRCSQNFSEQRWSLAPVTGPHDSPKLSLLEPSVPVSALGLGGLPGACPSQARAGGCPRSCRVTTDAPRGGPCVLRDKEPPFKGMVAQAETTPHGCTQTSSLLWDGGA